MEDLRQLRELLGLGKEGLGEEAVVVSQDKWHLLSERFPPDGATRLMLAAESGAKECVQLLLRCGADLDDRDTRMRRALDYSLGHPEVTLLLLQWDSLIPLDDERGQQKGGWMTTPIIKKFLAERDEFHRLLREEDDVIKIEAFLNSSQDSQLAKVKSKRWVNSKGKSAMCTAIMDSRYKAWTVLSTWRFVYATEEEKKGALMYEDDAELRRCVAERFVAIQGYHVEKMLQRSYTYRGEESESTLARRIEEFFREIDEEEYPSDILQCLQDDPSLEIIFDFSATRIGCMYPSNYGEAWGLTEFITNRIYAGALESSSEKFMRSDILSNLIHELAHKAFAEVFKNRGLPYKDKGDECNQKKYETVVEETFSKRFKAIYDPIITRAFPAERESKPVATIHDLKPIERELIKYELIVRVPEMIVKYKQQSVSGEGTLTGEDGLSSLRKQVPGLLEFYEKNVVRAVKEYIERNKKAGKAVRSELLNTPRLLSVHWREEVKVCQDPNNIGSPFISHHIKLRVLVVSNLSLGISHLKSSSPLENIMFVDWSRYQSASDYFASVLNRLDVPTLAILWDKAKEVPLCRNTGEVTCINLECPGKMMESIVERVILFVPTRFSHRFTIGRANNYRWKDLSADSKEWLKGKPLKLGGEWMKLIDIVGSVCGGMEEEIEEFINEKLDAEDISTLIDRESIDIGQPLNAVLMDRWREMLHGQTVCFEPRHLRLRKLELNKKLIDTRKDEAFVLINAEKNDLEDMGLKELPEWDSTSHFESQCYTASFCSSLDARNNLIAKICRKLIGELVDTSKRWKYVHFFEFVGGESINICSFKSCPSHKFSGEKLPLKFTGSHLLRNAEPNEALLIADAPGSGKSVFVNDLARRWKKRFFDSWVEVIDLSQFEDSFKELQGEVAKEKALHLLYDMVRVGRDTIEEKVFKLFYGARMKVIIFFDGFDEISPEYRQSVASFIKTLVSATLVQVVVTSRTHECQQLEGSLSTIAYCLVPFEKEQQVGFMRRQWIASLLSMPEQERSVKIESIASSLISLGRLNAEDKSSLVNALGSLDPRGKSDSSATDSHFNVLAEELMSSVEVQDTDETLTETPLHIWMLSSAAFEDDFPVMESLSVADIYHHFVDVKIRVLLIEKEKFHAYTDTNTTASLVKRSAYDCLKKSSVFFYLGDSEYELDEEEKRDVIRIGLVHERRGRMVFVHLTFAEYFFSLWLLELAERKKVSKLLLQNVLLMSKYEKVRNFMDCLIMSESRIKSVASEDRSKTVASEDGQRTLTRLKMTKLKRLKIAQLKRSAFPSSTEELTINLKMCLYTCIMECNEGILGYFFQNAKEHLFQFVFGHTIWRRITDDLSIYPLYQIEHISSKGDNAFFFLRQCLSDFLFPTRIRKRRYLMMLNKMLTLIRDYGLLWSIDSVILTKGKFWWMALEERDLLKNEQGRKQFKIMFEFLIENKDVLGKTLRKILVNYGICKLRPVALYAFELFVHFLDSILTPEDFQHELLFTESDCHKIFFRKVERFPLVDVKETWSYFLGKLSSHQQKVEFLAAKEWNVLLAAFLNKVDESVLSYVWTSLQRELPEKELKELIMDTVSEKIKSHCLDMSSVNVNAFHKWLCNELSNGFLTGEEMTRLLTSRSKYRGPLLFEHPSLLFTFQDYFVRDRDEFREVEKGFYERIASLCLSTKVWHISDFVEHVEKEWECVHSGLGHYWLDAIVETDPEVNGYLRHVQQENKDRVPQLALKAYVVLLERQLHLDRKLLGEEQFQRHVVTNWRSEENDFPIALCFGSGDWRRTACVFLGLFFGVLANFLPKSFFEQLLVLPSVGDVAMLAVDPMYDPLTFLLVYDVARWCMDEDSLWRVHSMMRKGGDQTVLECLGSEWVEESMSWDLKPTYLSLDELFDSL